MDLFTQVDEAKRPEWHEAPAALFLSWSAARQLSYCAARDRASAAEAETAEDAE